jgi:uncharacterized membrane protein
MSIRKSAAHYLRTSWNALKEIAESHKWHLAFFGLGHAIILPLLFYTIYQIPFSSIGLYFDYASKVMGGSLPYLDFTVEYPPFALFFFIVPRLFTSSYVVYAVAFEAELFLFDLLGLYLIYRIAQLQGKAPWKMLTVYSVAILAIGPIIAQSYDVFPAIIVLLSLYCFWIGKHKTSWGILALGVMTKIYPVAIAPIFLVYYIRNRQYKRIWSGILVFAASSLAIIVPFLIISPSSLLNLINYHAQRGIQIESIYSGFLIIVGKFGLAWPQPDFGAGSWNIVGPLADTVVMISTFVLAFLLLMSYWFIYSRIKPGKSQLMEMGTYSLLVVAVILITSKVLSPQYLIWLFPLLPLLYGKQRYAIWAVFVVIGALTYYIFPLHYTELIYLQNCVVAVLLVRNSLLVLLTVLAGISLYRLRTGYNPLQL